METTTNEVTEHRETKGGRVFLVGAGPGEPDLITLQAVRRLQAAEVVMYDYLANPLILQHAPAAADFVCLGRHGATRIWSQDEINEEMVRLAQEGKRVVRLKGGDPAIFGRFAEEAEFLTRHGIPFEVVPGLTAALTAGTLAGVPITHRDFASAVAFVTGHETDGKATEALDFEALAQFPGTLVFYMGVTTAQTWCQKLIDAGKDPTTPAVMVRRCSLPDQEIVPSTLGEVPAAMARLRPPVVTVIGPVAAPQVWLPWQQHLPLSGVTVLVTRAAEQAGELRDKLVELGAGVLVQPAIETTAALDQAALTDSVRDVGTRWDWIVFASGNGVRYYLDQLLSQGTDTRTLAGVKIASMGQGTTRALADYHLRPDLQPEKSHAESMVHALKDDVQGKRVLLVRASRGRDVLREQLELAGAHVDQVVAYQSQDVPTCNDIVRRAMDSQSVDWVTVTSSAIARSLHHLFGDKLRDFKLVSISPITSATLRELGLEPAAEATAYNMEGLVHAISDACRSNG